MVIPDVYRAEQFLPAIHRGCLRFSASPRTCGRQTTQTTAQKRTTGQNPPVPHKLHQSNIQFLKQTWGTTTWDGQICNIHWLVGFGSSTVAAKKNKKREASTLHDWSDRVMLGDWKNQTYFKNKWAESKVAPVMVANQDLCHSQMGSGKCKSHRPPKNASIEVSFGYQ